MLGHAAEQAASLRLPARPAQSSPGRSAPQRTPEVFLFDRERRLVYHGAIDDSRDEDAVERRYLRDALEASARRCEPPSPRRRRSAAPSSGSPDRAARLTAIARRCQGAGARGMIGACAAASLLLCALLAAAITASGARARPLVSIFYYPWFSTPPGAGATTTGRRTARSRQRASPPPTIRRWASTRRSIPPSWPTRCARSPGAGIDQIAVSWWGWGSPEDERLPLVIAAAHAEHLQVAVQIEDYSGRTVVDRGQRRRPSAHARGHDLLHL